MYRTKFHLNVSKQKSGTLKHYILKRVLSHVPRTGDYVIIGCFRYKVSEVVHNIPYKADKVRLDNDKNLIAIVNPDIETFDIYTDDVIDEADAMLTKLELKYWELV